MSPATSSVATLKTAVVTGASSGIGRATAHRLAEEGFRLFLLGRNMTALEALASELPDTTAIELDLSDTARMEEAVADFVPRIGPVDAVVNCAGAMMNRRVGSITSDEILHVFATNVVAPFLMSQTLLPQLRESKGCIVNVASVSALQGVSSQSIYSASKGALTSLTRSMATEFGKFGVRVNAVAPGIIKTPMSEPYATPDYEEESTRGIPLGRWGDPDDIASVITFLCTDAARYITGQVIPVDGGLGGLYWLSNVKSRKPPDSQTVTQRQK